jgi:hypothetical protein
MMASVEPSRSLTVVQAFGPGVCREYIWLFARPVEFRNIHDDLGASENFCLRRYNYPVLKFTQ